MLHTPLLENKPNDMESYVELILKEEKTYFDILYKNKPWPHQDKLAQKVCPDGKLVKYYGDTTVFKLLPDQLDIFKKMQQDFRGYVSEVADPIVPDTFHMTLHDLSNGPDPDILTAQCQRNIPKVEKAFRKIAEELKKTPEIRKISYDFSALYPSHFIVSTVSMLPSTERDFNISMNLYHLIDEILYLPRPLFPHITLDYWALHAKDADKSNMIKAFKEINSHKFSIEFDLHELAYQHFTSMNHYEDIFTVKDFL